VVQHQKVCQRHNPRKFSLPRAKVWQKLNAHEKTIHISRGVRSRLRWIVDRLPEVGNIDYNTGNAVHKRAVHKRACAISPAGFFHSREPHFFVKCGRAFFGRLKLLALGFFMAWIKLLP
jgi:hypothetical protein